MRRKPYSVILFDEVEKAHKLVFGVLLQLLDDGRLTDGQGVTVDFSNVVVIMTSNLGAQHLLEDITPSGGISEGARARVMDAVRGHFAPEFLNRLDDIVMFNPLTKEDLGSIIKIQVANLAERLKDRNIDMEVTEPAITLALSESYDPLYGARPLRRYIEKKISTQLSKMILGERLQNNSKIFIGADGHDFTFSVEAKEKPRSRSHSPAPRSKKN